MKRTARKPNRAAFTMIELMVVVAVLAVIAIPIYGKYVQNSRVTEATARIGEIVIAAKSYAMANTVTGLVAETETTAATETDGATAPVLARDTAGDATEGIERTAILSDPPPGSRFPSPPMRPGS